MPSALGIWKHWQSCSTAVGQSGNWGSELGGDARPSRDQEPMSAQVPLILVLFASPDTVCPLVEGKSRRKEVPEVL